MIVAENSTPTLEEFQFLMSKVDRFLNEDATLHPKQYEGRNGTSLEPIIKDVVQDCAMGTPFQGRITLVSGAQFPDIVAADYYGIEVKSTNKDHWTSTGSSILESTRIKNVERIYLTFGKLAEPIQFMSRPYEECLSEIRVTHFPRYIIDMRLQKGKTIFDKMDISYDELRSCDNPVVPVANYYRKHLHAGESLWWAGGEKDVAETTAPIVVRLWSSLSAEERHYYESCLFLFFPKTIMSSSQTKYSEAILWLVTQHGIVFPNIRDAYSAGGKVFMPMENGSFAKMPKVFDNIRTHLEKMISVSEETPTEDLKQLWGVSSIEGKAIDVWIQLVTKEAKTQSEKDTAYSVLRRCFK